MPKYIVSAMLQSADRSNAPVDQRWYTGDDLVQAIAAMVSAAARHEDVDAHVPASVRYSTLGVHLSIEQESATPSTGTCKHCGRLITQTDEGWVDLAAGYDDEDGDGIWRTSCDAHDTFVAEHEPRP